ncbi:MAG: hypothetical protein AAF721_25430, partial [Myxococcota bacterium]
DAVEGRGEDGKEPSASAATPKPGEPPVASTLEAVQVAAGYSAACALMSDGTVRCWGRNDLGEHGVEPATIDAATPVAVPGVSDATDIWMGGDSGSSGDMICVRDKAEAVSCWGSRHNKPVTDGKKWTSAVETLPALAGARDLALGGGTQYAILADGTVAAWGSSAFNAIGDGDTSSSTRGLTKVPGITGAVALAAGQNHGCALLDDGTVSCWGYVTPKQGPTKIEGLSGVVAIGAGSGRGDTCAITKDKTVQCWNGKQTPKAEAGLADATLVRARNHKCALSEDGTVRCWGGNDRGQAGTGEAGGRNREKQPVVGLGKAVHIDVGMNFACAALEDGSVQCWGWNNRGQLGDGTLIDAAKPVTVASLTAPTLPSATDGADKAQEADTDMDWSGVPAACTKPSKVDAKNKHLDGDFNVVSAYASTSGEGKYVKVSLANYKMNPQRPGESPRGKQFQLSMSFGRVDLDSKAVLPVDTGEYVFGLEQQRKVSSSVKHKAGSSSLMRLSLEGASPGTVTIAHLDEAWVCGELKLATKHSSFSGPWAARLIND